MNIILGSVCGFLFLEALSLLILGLIERQRESAIRWVNETFCNLLYIWPAIGMLVSLAGFLCLEALFSSKFNILALAPCLVGQVPIAFIVWIELLAWFEKKKWVR